MPTPRERFIAALERKPLTGRVPHFELVFFLTMEALGRVHPTHMSFSQWDQMEEKERQLIREYVADTYLLSAEKYEHSALFPQGMPVPGHRQAEEVTNLLRIIREKSGDRYFVMLHGDATFSVPDGNHMVEFAEWLADDPERVHRQAAEMVDNALRAAERWAGTGLLDGFALCADYCFNTGPFLSPRQFSEFVTPYLQRLIAGYRDMGYYVIKHTDGNIMPILDQLVQANPHALHSLDPQGHVDIAEVKRLVGDRVCLIGNVSCSALDTGTDEDVIESTRYALRHGMPGGGYIFSTSNCIYTGMRLERYDLMQRIWKEEGNYV